MTRLVRSPKETRIPRDLFAALADILRNKYLLDSEIGRGGMARVYLAKDLRYSRDVAIKLLDPSLLGFRGWERFLREVETLARLNHPNILPLLDSGEADDLVYYVMPFVPGETLRDRLTREHALPIGDAVAIALEMADALAYAHSHGVVHRDLKPENILFSSGHALLADFGVAAIISDVNESGHESEGFALGTPAYMSPEQATGEHHLDGRTDLYALGVVLFEMLAGAPPFGFSTPQVVMAKHRSEPPPSVRQLRPSVPPFLEAIVNRLLAKTPADRFTTALELRQALLAGPAAPHRISFRRFTWIPVSLVVIALLAALVFRPNRGSPPVRNVSTPPQTELAVLYFDDQSADNSLGYLARGLTEDLINRLQQQEILGVRSPEAVRPYRASSIPLQQLARQLGVGMVVSGSVARFGPRIRVTVRLSDAVSGRQLESAQREVQIGDLLELRDSVADEVARSLRRRLGRELQLRELRESTGNDRAWTLARQAEDLRDEAGVAPVSGAELYPRADSLLAQAERLDRRWIEPTVLRGWVAFDQAGWERANGKGLPAVRASLRSATEHAERAIILDSTSPPALELLGTIKYRQFALGVSNDTMLLQQAERHLRTAAAVPGLRQAAALRTLSAVLATEGRSADAYNSAERAYRLDAYLSDGSSIVALLYGTALDLGKDAEAVQWCAEGRRAYPDNWFFVHCQLTLFGWSPLVIPDVKKAWALAAEAVKLEAAGEGAGLPQQAELLTAGVLARVGLRDSASRVAERARRKAVDPLSPELIYDDALVHMRLNDNARTLLLLDTLVRIAPQYRMLLKTQRTFRPLQSDSTFLRLMGRD
ncbi:MAG: protein kinase [Gemmatimonadota bacterium]